MFKIGDKVRVKVSDSVHPMHQGKEFTVAGSYLSTDRLYLMEEDEVSVDFFEEELELIEEAEDDEEGC